MPAEQFPNEVVRIVKIPVIRPEDRLLNCWEGSTVINAKKKVMRIHVRRWLALNAVLDDESSDALDLEGQKETEEFNRFHPVGSGRCGHIFSFQDKRLILKRAKVGCAADLRMDAYFHQKIYESVKAENPPYLRVPEFHSLVEEDDEFWNDEAHHCLREGSLRAPILFSEKIFPLPSHIRQSMIDLFAPGYELKEHHSHERNRDCLARLYLGRRLPELDKRPSFSLRNYGMSLEVLEYLRLEQEPLAIILADALALMHWDVRCDARGVEFAFGTSVKPNPEVQLSHDLPEILRKTVHVWLFDFNQCRDMMMDKNGIARAVDAFWENDPYYPRPNSWDEKDENLWQFFMMKYLVKSHDILKKRSAAPDEFMLPKMFIDEMIQRGKVRYPWGVRHSGIHEEEECSPSPSPVCSRVNSSCDLLEDLTPKERAQLYQM